MTPEEWANCMAQHIIGHALASDNEACRACIKMAEAAISDARSEALEEAAAEVKKIMTGEMGEIIAAAIRGLK